MACVAGVDGCRGGWLVVKVEFEDEVVSEEAILCPGFREVLSISPRPRVFAVDVPIGLLEVREIGGRQCDRAARKVLGKQRSGSVFSPPVRPALGIREFAEAGQWGLNRQSFSILGKVREVDEVMTPDLQYRVYEVHPEVSFFVMDGLTPQTAGKRSAPGREARYQLLSRFFHQLDEVLRRYPASSVSRDDVYDAYAAAWTAMRIHRREAGRLPDDPPRDEKGLEMAIHY
jgi:predicted RNase H-like nuclease